MNKETFIKLMTELASIKKAEDNLNTAFKKFSHFNYISFGRYEELVVRSLEFGMNDKDRWISYWIYDCEMGKEDMNVKDRNGKKIPTKTLTNLYNLIKKTNE